MQPPPLSRTRCSQRQVPSNSILDSTISSVDSLLDRHFAPVQTRLCALSLRLDNAQRALEFGLAALASASAAVADLVVNIRLDSERTKHRLASVKVQRESELRSNAVEWRAEEANRSSKKRGSRSVAKPETASKLEDIVKHEEEDIVSPDELTDASRPESSQKASSHVNDSHGQKSLGATPEPTRSRQQKFSFGGDPNMIGVPPLENAPRDDACVIDAARLSQIPLSARRRVANTTSSSTFSTAAAVATTAVTLSRPVSSTKLAPCRRIMVQSDLGRTETDKIGQAVAALGWEIVKDSVENLAAFEGLECMIARPRQLLSAGAPLCPNTLDVYGPGASVFSTGWRFLCSPRTMIVILRGIPIATPEWLYMCVQTGDFLPFDKWGQAQAAIPESRQVSPLVAVRSRESTSEVFRGARVGFCSSFFAQTTPSRHPETIRLVVEAVGGGSLVFSKASASARDRWLAQSAAGSEMGWSEDKAAYQPSSVRFDSFVDFALVGEDHNTYIRQRRSVGADVGLGSAIVLTWTDFVSLFPGLCLTTQSLRSRHSTGSTVERIRSKRALQASNDRSRHSDKLGSGINSRKNPSFHEQKRPRYKKSN